MPAAASKEPLNEYTRIIRSLPGLYMIASMKPPRYCIAAVSNAWLKASRLKSKTLTGQNALAVFSRESFRLTVSGKAALKRAMKQAADTKRPVTLRGQPILTRTGKGPSTAKPVWWDILISPLPGLKNEITHILISMTAAPVLRDAKYNYRELVDASPDAIVLIDEKRKIVELNQSAKKMFGYTKRELIGHEIEKLIPARFRQPHKVLHEVYFAHPSARRMGSDLELFAIRKDGSEFPVEIGLLPLLSEKGLQIGATIRDISDRKKNEERLKASERRYRLMFNENPYPTFICDSATHRILEVNDSATVSFQYSHEEFGRLTTHDIFFGLQPEQSMSTGPVAGLPHSLEIGKYRARKKDGEFRIIETKSFYLDYQGKLAIQILVNDITEVVKLQEALINHQKLMEHQIREAMFRAQEEEREHIGKELHDNINQLLATARLFFMTKQEEDNHPDELLSKGILNLDKAIAEIRQLASGLVMHEIMEAGLVTSLQSLVDTINLTKKVRIELRAQLYSIEMTEDQQIAIYRIVQEQLSNILRHSHAREVRIELRSKHREITLRIKDDGKGFDAGEVRKGIGITNIINRVKLFDGDVRIDTGPNKGCQLEVQMSAKSSKKLTVVK